MLPQNTACSTVYCASMHLTQTRRSGCSAAAHARRLPSPVSLHHACAALLPAGRVEGAAGERGGPGSRPGTLVSGKPTSGPVACLREQLWKCRRASSWPSHTGCCMRASSPCVQPAGLPRLDQAEGRRAVHRQHGLPLLVSHLVDHAVPCEPCTWARNSSTMRCKLEAG